MSTILDFLYEKITRHNISVTYLSYDIWSFHDGWSEIFSSCHLCQLAKNHWCLNLCPHHWGLMWHEVQTIPCIYQPAACDRNWMRANGVLVGGVISLFVLILSLDWFVMALLYHISHRVPGPTQIENPVPVEISGMKPDFSGHLYKVTCLAWCFIQYGSVAEIDVVTHFRFVFCHCWFLWLGQAYEPHMSLTCLWLSSQTVYFPN